MKVSIQSQHTSRFIDFGCYITAAVAGVMFAVYACSGFLGKLLISTDVIVDQDEPAELRPISIQPQAIGALRIDVNAVVPYDRWVTYEIQLRDQQNQIIASAIKYAWAESGTWYEEGESGTWQEQDLWAGLDIKTAQPETLNVSIAVLEYTTASGVELDEDVTLKVKVWDGVVDRRYLLAGFMGATGLAVLSFVAVSSVGDRVVSKSIGDSDVGDRAVMGGRDRLVRVAVEIKSDETSPAQLTVNLFINDQDGEQIYADAIPVRLHIARDHKRRVTGAVGSVCRFFILE
ncbi:MAG TPA: hypothetical protein V6C88_13420, partial [Chroococcidiopsis sp.]